MFEHEDSSLNTYDDQELYRKWCQGCLQAGNELYKRYRMKLYFYYFLRTGNSHDALDLTGETWVRLIQGLDSFEERSSFRSWLFSIAYRVLVDYYRLQKKSQKAWEEWNNWKQDGTVEEASQALEEKELIEVVEECLEKLSPRNRGFLILNSTEEYSFSDIASLSGLTREGSRKICHKAKEMIQLCVRQKLGESSG
ncbi:MAG: RNA polymerase sigma factor [Planctomycetota bacterium]|nr:MAG: RNA polymerase sigma factor [Planctomycetota bacterium]